MKNLSIILSVILISISCSGKKEKHTYADTTFNRIDFKDVTFTINKKTKDTLQIEGLLKQKTIIDGIPCYGSISFDSDWSLKNFTLAGTHPFGRYSFPSGTHIELTVGMNSLKSPYIVMAGAIVNFCKFPPNQLVDGFPSDSIEGVIFTTDWNLRELIFGDDVTIAGNVLKKGTLAVFNKDKGFRIWCLYDPLIQGYQCSGTSYKGAWNGGGGIDMYANGRLARFKTTDDIEIHGVLCDPHRIHLYESGKLKKCKSAKDQTIDGKFYEKKFTLEFDEEGNVTKSYKKKFFN